MRASIGLERRRGQAGIHQVGGSAGADRLRDQVRPQLRLHENQRLRLRVAQKAAHRPRNIVGRVAVRHIVAEQRPHAIAAARRHGGHEHRVFRQPRLHAANHRSSGVRLPRRHGVEPDDAPAKPWRIAEALADALPIARLPPTAPQKAQQEPGQGKVQQQRVEESQKRVLDEGLQR